MLEKVRYPDQKDGIWFDSVDYNDLVKELNDGVETLQGQLKDDFQATLDELQRRWGERQKSPNIQILDTTSAFRLQA